MALKGKILLETSTIIKQDIPYIAGPKSGSMVAKVLDFRLSESLKKCTLQDILLS